MNSADNTPIVNIYGYDCANSIILEFPWSGETPTGFSFYKTIEFPDLIRILVINKDNHPERFSIIYPEHMGLVGNAIPIYRSIDGNWVRTNYISTTKTTAPQIISTILNKYNELKTKELLSSL